MPYLRLIDVLTGRTLEFEQEEIRIGRGPHCDIVPEGVGAEVVSGDHVRFLVKGDSWLVEDLGSRNGTFIGDIPAPGHVPRPVEVGIVIGLGERGPRYRVDALAKIVFDQTIQETPKMSRPSAPTLPLSAYGATEPFDASGMPESGKPPKTTEAKSIEPVPSPPPPSVTEKATERMESIDATPAPESVPPERVGVLVVVVETRSGERWEAQGGRIRVGRGKECELRPIGPSDTSVSRVHAEILLQPNGRVVIRDVQSRNGTLVNKEFIAAECEIKVGDRIQLGAQGPDLSLDVLELPAGSAADSPPTPPPHEEPGALRRSRVCGRDG